MIVIGLIVVWNYVIIWRIIRRIIIYNNNPIVAIVLIKDRLKIILKSKILGIIEAGNYDAERNLSLIFTIMIGLLQSILLIF